MLKVIYKTEYTNSPAQSNVASITFAGTVVGMVFFGYTSDHISRKWSLLCSTIIVILFAALSAGSYGYHDNIHGLFAALTAYRFFLGIGIGGEYPAGSVGCAESTGELESGTRNRWFILFTNVQIDFGFVVAAIVPMIVVCLFNSLSNSISLTYTRSSQLQKTIFEPLGASALASALSHLSPSYTYGSNSKNPKPTSAKPWHIQRLPGPLSFAIIGFVYSLSLSSGSYTTSPHTHSASIPAPSCPTCLGTIPRSGKVLAGIPSLISSTCQAALAEALSVTGLDRRRRLHLG